jgi:hypothetical protein
MDERTQAEAAALLSCSVCDSVCTPEVRQCRNGHLTCNLCLGRLTKDTCPVCRAPGAGSARNLSADGLVVLLDPVVACPHAVRGCTAMFNYGALQLHLADECVVVKHLFPCPVQRCNQKLPRDELFSHFLAQHSFFCLDRVRYLHLKAVFDRKGQGPSFYLEKHDREFFLTSLATGPDDWCIWMWLLGEEKEAELFEYAICIPRPHGVVEEVFRSKVASLREDPEKLFGLGKCYKTARSVGDRKPFVIQIKIKKL